METMLRYNQNNPFLFVEWGGLEGAKMGFKANVTWEVTVYWECIRNAKCESNGSFYNSTVITVTGIQWISYSATQGVEIPTFNTVLEGIGMVASELLAGPISWPVDVGQSDINKILKRPIDSTVLSNMKPIKHICKE